MPKKSNKLTTLQKNILDSFLDNGYNMTKAVQDHKPGITYQSQRRYGTTLRNNERAQDYINERQNELKRQANIQAHNITQELIRIATADITNYIGLSADQLKNLTTPERRALKKVSIRKKSYITKQGQKITEEQINIETHDKIKALETLGKRINYFALDNSSKAPRINIQNIKTDTLNQLLTALDTQQDTPGT